MIDINKRYRTRSGNKVRIHTIRSGSKKFPVMGTVNRRGEWYPASWSKDGYLFEGSQSPVDLVEIPAKPADLTIFAALDFCLEGSKVSIKDKTGKVLWSSTTGTAFYYLKDWFDTVAEYKESEL